MKRMLAILKARNYEFIRDRGALAWNFIFPLFIIIGISLAFNTDRALFQVGIKGSMTELSQAAPELANLPHLQFIEVDDWQKAQIKLEQHQYHLLVDTQTKEFWVNALSREGQFLDSVLSQSELERHEFSSKKLRYVDWILPGILAINMMYGSLYGVGYVVVRYRKNGYLKRLQATPLKPIEFISAQLISRLIISQIVIAILFAGCYALLRPEIYGQIWLLLLISVLGAFSLTSLGLLLCSRVMSEELSRGFLEMMAWPMLLLTEAWFSLDQAHPALQWVSKCLPLTYIIDGWRSVLYYGANFTDVQGHLIFLFTFGLIGLIIGAKLFRWHPNQG